MTVANTYNGRSAVWAYVYQQRIPRTLMAQGERVNPAVLVWARETAGLDVKSAARQIGLGATQDTSSEGKLLEFERGDRLPSRSQLSSIAKAYRRPLVVFYMPSPPPGELWVL